MELTVIDNPTLERFEAHTETGAVAGFVGYERHDGVVTLTHTEVDPAFGGQGVGTTLVRDTLAALRADGDRVRPLCPFVKRYLEGHPDEADLVAT